MSLPNYLIIAAQIVECSVILFFALAATIFGQYPPSLQQNETILRNIEWQRVRRQLDRLDNINKTKSVTPKKSEDNPQIILDSIYRRSTDSERRLMTVEKEDISKFENFLAKPGTGIAKLIRDFGCDEYSPVTPNKPICTEFSMPGGGSAFSFRQSDYQFWKLSDLLYDGKSFIAFGQMSLGFIVDLDDIPIDSVGLDSKALSYVTNFQPSTDGPSVTKQNNDFVDGIKSDGQLYKKFLPAVVNHTYLLRSIAFKGKVSQQHFEIKYNELDFDKRKDIIVAFRVIRSDINGSMTIIWKTLLTKPAPELKLTK